MGAWFRGPLATWGRDVILDSGTPLVKWFDPKALSSILEEHIRGRVDHGKRIYALVTLAIWAGTR